MLQEENTSLAKCSSRDVCFFRSIMVLCEADVLARWSRDIVCTDASLSGYAVMRQTVPQELPESVRGHMSGGASRGPRVPEWRHDQQLGRAWMCFQTLTSLTRELMAQPRWDCLWAPPIHYPESIHRIEARSILALVKHLAKDSRYHGRRVAVFNDNMGVCPCHFKGSLLQLWPSSALEAAVGPHLGHRHPAAHTLAAVRAQCRRCRWQRPTKLVRRSCLVLACLDHQSSQNSGLDPNVQCIPKGPRNVPLLRVWFLSRCLPTPAQDIVL